jgi:hypothetical protein
MHRQGCRNYRNIAQSGNERYAGATWDGEQYELQQVPIDNSSTTSGVFAANPHRPIFNPYTHRSNYKNTRYLKHKRNRRYKERQFKLAYAHQQERDQNPERKKHKRSVETKKTEREKTNRHEEKPTSDTNRSLEHMQYAKQKEQTRTTTTLSRRPQENQ